MANKTTPPTKSTSKAKKTKQYTVGEAQRRLSASTHGKAEMRKWRRVQQAKNEERRRALQKLDRSRLPINTTFGGQKCFPGISVYGGESVKSKNRQWICSALGQIRFEERDYAVRECEVRVFIEGAEVSPYLRGTFNWTIQTTGGMNTCSFTLNNNHDAFILTPANVCSKTDLHGWRIPQYKSGSVISTAQRDSRNVDESAKWVIYNHKYGRVRPDSDNPQIDPDTGMWLYPLHPWHSIITRHDCVRAFIRLPHVSGINRFVGTGKNRKSIEYREVWAPAFTGFVDEVDWEDEPVIGDRLMNVRCYDWRGLLRCMRVRVFGSPLASKSDKQKELDHTIFSEQKKEEKVNAWDRLKSEATKLFKVAYLDDLHKLCLTQDLIGRYNAAFEANVLANCRKGGNILDCQKEVYRQVRTQVAAEIKAFKEAWLALRTSMQDATKADGVRRELSRQCNDDKAVLKTTGSSIADARKIASKTATWLRTKGAAVEGYAYRYAAAYIELATERSSEGTRVKHNWRSVDWFTDYLPTDPVLFSVYNKYSAITSIDEELKQKYPDVYAGARIGTESGKISNHANDLHETIYNTVVADFASVTQKVKNDIDAEVRKVVRGRAAVDPTVQQLPSTGDVISRSLFTRKTISTNFSGVELKTLGSLVIFAKATTTSGNVIGTTSLQVSKALNNWLKSASQIRLSGSKDKVTKTLDDFNKAVKTLLDKLKAAEDEATKRIRASGNVRNQAQLDKIRRRYEDAQQKGKSNRTKQADVAGNIADLVLTDAKFNEANVGMFGDLVRAIGQNSHPLAGMSYEMAVEWLTLTKTPLTKGFEQKLAQYDRAALESWNMLMVFGVVGRPLTYGEVTEMGLGTVTELDATKAPYSPLNAFVHMLLPKDGTGAQTIVQQDITHNPGAATSYTYQTRDDLLTEISRTLDYQFFVTPAGDLAFEFPNYNALPYDYGTTFQGAYTVLKGLRNFRFTPETGEMNTAWVLTGAEPDRLADNVTGDMIVENQFKKVVIVAKLLARRIGIKVRNLKVSMPGVGAVLLGANKKQPLSSLMAYGLLEIQREMGRMAQASVTYDFRPYMLPNRPLHVVHRQRMALIQSVNYSMVVPGGECSVATNLHYVRSLMNDGSFRHIAGGARMPVDYSGIFSGDVKQTIRYGQDPNRAPAARAESANLRDAVLGMSGRRQPRSVSNWSCGTYMKDRWIEASWSYSDQIDAAFRKADTYTDWTSGSLQQKGTLPPVPRGGHGYIARKFYRPPESKGAPSEAVTMKGTGLGRSDNDPQNPRKSHDSKFYGKFYNPWPFGQRVRGYKGLNRFNNFGFTRVVYPSGKPSSHTKPQYATFNRKKYRTYSSYIRKHRGHLQGWHNGMDFVGVRPNTKAYTPITLYATGGYVSAGYGAYPNTTANYRWVVGPPKQSMIKPGSDIARFGVRPSGKKIVSKPDPTAPLVPDQEALAKFAREAAAGKEVPAEVPKIPARRLWKIDVQAMRIWNKAGGNLYVSRTGSTKLGLVIWGLGYATLPGAKSEKVACKIQYIHCADFVKDSRGKQIGTYRGGRPEENMVRADSPVCVVGSTGSDNIHLHFEMYIYPPGAEPPALQEQGGTSTSAWRSVLKANGDFLRTQMKMKITAGNGINSGKMNASWKRYFEQANQYTGSPITTVDEATDYMLSKSSRYRSLTDPKGKKRIVTNPAFFFKPEQIIPDLKQDYMKYLAARSDVFYEDEDSATGQSVCGSNSSVRRQKISLSYHACLGQARKLRTRRNRKDARKVCKEKRQIAVNKLSGGNVTVRSRRSGNQSADRTHQKTDQLVQQNITTGASSPSTRNST